MCLTQVLTAVSHWAHGTIRLNLVLSGLLAALLLVTPALNRCKSFTQALVVAHQAVSSAVPQGVLTVGDTVLFLTLMAQLYGPLNFFGTYYRVIQQYMIDMENLLHLLDTPGKVVDAPNAPDLVLSNGTVEFQDVSFGYEPGLSVLKGVSSLSLVFGCSCFLGERESLDTKIAMVGHLDVVLVGPDVI